jgi:hypothetical protein
MERRGLLLAIVSVRPRTRLLRDNRTAIPPARSIYGLAWPIAAMTGALDLVPLVHAEESELAPRAATTRMTGERQ